MNRRYWRVLMGLAIPVVPLLLSPFLNTKTTIALFVYLVVMLGGYLVITSLPDKKQSYLKDKKYGCH